MPNKLRIGRQAVLSANGTPLWARTENQVGLVECRLAYSTKEAGPENAKIYTCDMNGVCKTRVQLADDMKVADEKSCRPVPDSDCTPVRVTIAHCIGGMPIKSTC